MIIQNIFIGEDFNEDSLEEMDVYCEPHYLQIKKGRKYNLLDLDIVEKIHKIRQFLHTK